MNKQFILMILGLVTMSGARGATFGPVENFDVVNDTGKTAHGFEIEMEDLSQSEVTSIFGDATRWPDMERYGAPSVIEISNPAATRTGKNVRITYSAGYNGGWSAGTPSGTLPVNPSDSCWPYGAPDYGPNYPCDHFGVSSSVPAAAVRYSWLLEQSPGSSQLVKQDAGVPAPQWTVTPQPPKNNIPQPPKVNVVIAAPQPQAYEFGEARWVKVTATGTLADVGVEDLMAEGAVIQKAKTQTQVEWQLLQVDKGNPKSGQIDLSGVALDEGASGVVYRFEFYRYTGSHDAGTYEALPKTSDTPKVPDQSDLGPFIVAQMAGVNFDGKIPPLPAPPAAPAINASIPDIVLNRDYKAVIDATASDPADVLSYAVTGLPAGLSVDAVTGVISGKVSDAGLVGQVFNLTIEVTDVTNSTHTSASTPLSVVDGQITFSPLDQYGVVGEPFAYTLEASGGSGTFSYQLVDGLLPDGLSLDGVSGLISGTPGTEGISAASFMATDSQGYTSSNAALNFNIAAALLPGACSGVNEVITDASNVQEHILETLGGPNNGGPVIQIALDTTTIKPPLTDGDFFKTGNLISYSGILSGGVCASDQTSIMAGLSLLPVPEQIVVQGLPIQPVKMNVSGGVPPYTLSAGNLPAGLSFDAAIAEITGVIDHEGVVPVTVSVSDASGQSSYVTVNFTVTTVSPIAMPGGVIPQVFTCKAPKGTRKSSAKSIITSVDGSMVHTKSGKTLNVLPCATVKWKKNAAQVFSLKDRISWNGWLEKKGKVVQVNSVTLK